MTFDLTVKIDKTLVRKFKEDWGNIKEDFSEVISHLLVIEDNGLIHAVQEEVSFAYREIADIIVLLNRYNAEGDIECYDYDSMYQMHIIFDGKGFFKVKENFLVNTTCASCMKDLINNYVVINGEAYCSKECAMIGEL